jgi:hypothetical protein
MGASALVSSIATTSTPWPLERADPITSFDRNGS